MDWLFPQKGPGKFRELAKKKKGKKGKKATAKGKKTTKKTVKK